MKDLIKKYISSDIASYIHIDELLDRDHTIEYASDNGFIIHDNLVNFTYISFSDLKEMKDILSTRKYKSYIAYEKEIVDFYGDSGKTKNLIQYYYPSNKKFTGLEEYDLRILDESYIDILDKYYKAIGPNESNLERLEKKEVIGIFENNELAGIVGRHPEGCIGMLLVFEKHRGKGYATILEKAKINDLIDRKQRVFNEVVDGNEISIKIQTKLGYIRGSKLLYWKL